MMRTTLVRTVALLLAVLWTSVAVQVQAKDRNQAVVDAYLERWSDGDSLRTLEHLAECVAGRHPRAADAFVRNASDALALQKDQERLVDAKCVKQYWFRSSKTSVDPDMYRMMLAEALLEMTYATKPLPSLGNMLATVDRPSLPEVPIEDVHPFYRDMFVIDRLGSQLARFSDCLARAQPDAVRALASTERRSSEERALLERLDAATPQCVSSRPAVNYPSYQRRGDLMLQLYLLTQLAGGAVSQEAS